MRPRDLPAALAALGALGCGRSAHDSLPESLALADAVDRACEEYRHNSVIAEFAESGSLDLPAGGRHDSSELADALLSDLQELLGSVRATCPSDRWEEVAHVASVLVDVAVRAGARPDQPGAQVTWHRAIIDHLAATGTRDEPAVTTSGLSSAPRRR